MILSKTAGPSPAVLLLTARAMGVVTFEVIGAVSRAGLKAVHAHPGMGIGSPVRLTTKKTTLSTAFTR